MLQTECSRLRRSEHLLYGIHGAVGRKGEKECNLHIEEKRLSEQKKNLILMVLK
uniref:Uncharacterized protein n=1 Tax=Podoviridae sp. ct1h53 TaxID=2826536 RepID=A0A8S5MH07_9CAUD|nr:MAG TPA: hypothetical protein [Podoviridae sp. ct1h53]